MYVTNKYIITTYIGQIGELLNNLVDENDKIFDLDNNKTIDSFEGEKFYLSETGDIVVTGGTLCGIDCNYTKEVVRLTYSNGKLNVTKK